MKGKKMVLAVILALIGCLVLIPTCAFADDDQVLSGDNSMAGSSTMDGGNSSDNSDDGDDNDNGAGSGSGDANLNDNGSEAGNGGNDGNVGGSDAGTPGSTEGSSENGDDSDNGEDENQSDPGDKEPAEEESDGSGDVNEEPKEEDGASGGDDAQIGMEPTTLEGEGTSKFPRARLLYVRETTTLEGEGTSGVSSNEASIGGTWYPTLEEAIAKANNGDTIKIESDIEGSPSYEIRSGQTITIDLNGRTITSRTISELIKNYGNLTINDSVGGGILKTTSNSYTVKTCADATTTLNGGTYINTDNFAALGNDGGDMTINSGVKVVGGSNDRAISSGASSSGSSSVSTTIIDGAEIDGTVNNLHNSNITIKGGKFTGKGSSNNVIWNPDTDRNVTISGGNFTGTIRGNNIAISGGTFSVDPSKYVEDTVVVESNGKYAVGESGYDLAKDGGTVTVVKAPDGEKIDDVPVGVKIVNNSGNTIYINGVEVKIGETYTVPEPKPDPDPKPTPDPDPKPAEDNKTETSAAAAAIASAPLYAKYLVLEGKGQQWTDGDLEFVLNSNAVVKVLIDGVEVEFTVAEDGTVTIASAVIEALEAGTHEIQFIFADGSCMTTFTK